MARRYGGTQRRLRKTNCDCTSCINPEAGETLSNSSDRALLQHNITSPTRPSPRMLFLQIAFPKELFSASLCLKFQHRLPRAQWNVALPSLGRRTIRPPSVLAWILFRCKLVCSRVFCTGCLGEVDMRVSQILRRLECMSMNMGSDCYGSFAHGIGVELLTESVQV